jgi:hypothetical protein
MQYLLYFAVAAPLVLAWLFWAAAQTPATPPLFHSFDDELHQAAVLRKSALAERQTLPRPGRPAPAGRTQSRALSARPLPR